MRPGSGAGSLLAACAVVAAIGLLATVVGAGGFGAADVGRVIAAKLGGGPAIDPTAETILWELRLPRVLLGALVGAGLGTAGCITQGLFRNPLAEPGLLGVGAGASTFVVGGFLLGLDEGVLWASPVLAALGGAMVLLLLILLTAGSDGVAPLLLTGVALAAVFGSLTTFLLSFSVESWILARKAMAWLLGSFDARGWDHLGYGAPFMVVGLLGAFALHRRLDLLALGEETAATMGVDRGRTKLIACAIVGLLSGTATATVGSIGFVGLMVPHVVRALVRPSHAMLLPASALGGAGLVIVVDTVSRAVAPMYLPPGAITGLLGGLFFVWLLRRGGRS